MNLQEKIERSKSTERIDFSKYKSIGIDDPLVKISNSKKLEIEPCWTLENDWEGKRYADYIAEHPEYDGIYVRPEVARRLENAAASLNDKYKLVVRAGHRPIEVQKRILIECAQDYKKDNPDVSDKEALAHAREYVSDPATTLPPHVCGAAIDVELVDSSTGDLIDFGSNMNDDTDASSIYYSDLTQAQKANRQILLQAMLGAGFASCKPEWWHFSYGDQVWAWFYGEARSLYDPVNL